MTESRIDSVNFRAIMSAFPTGVAVVTTRDQDSRPRGFTCNALCSVSMAPPMLLVCVAEGSRSLQAMRDCGGFVVNFLRENREWVSSLFASPAEDKFSRVTWMPSDATGLPWICEDTIAHAECQVTAEVEAGDHSVVLGAIVAGSSRVDSLAPLMYWRRRYGTWPDAHAESLAVALAAEG